MLRRLLTDHRLHALLWSLVVAVLLLAPGDDLAISERWDWLDKPAHAALFAVQAALLASALGAERRRGRELAAALVSGLYAALLELAQLWVPGRGFDFWDLVADAAGIGAVCLLLGWRRASIPPSP